MLPRIVGHAHALDLLMSARRVQSDEALRIGLVNRLYPSDQLREQTYAYARDLADFVSPSAIAVIKRQLYDVPFQTLAEAPSTPTARWRWRCAAAIFAKALRASWRSGRRGLRGSEIRCGIACRGPSSPCGLRRGSLRYERARRAEAGAACEGWWSQAGSNRRPRHCERRALPAELWPHRDRLAKGGGQ